MLVVAAAAAAAAKLLGIAVAVASLGILVARPLLLAGSRRRRLLLQRERALGLVRVQLAALRCLVLLLEGGLGLVPRALLHVLQVYLRYMLPNSQCMPTAGSRRAEPRRKQQQAKRAAAGRRAPAPAPAPSHPVILPSVEIVLGGHQIHQRIKEAAVRRKLLSVHGCGQRRPETGAHPKEPCRCPRCSPRPSKRFGNGGSEMVTAALPLQHA
jgi:hypothetical protein